MGLTRCYKTTVFLHLYVETSTLNQYINLHCLKTTAFALLHLRHTCTDFGNFGTRLRESRHAIKICFAVPRSHLTYKYSALAIPSERRKQ